MNYIILPLCLLCLYTQRSAPCTPLHSYGDMRRLPNGLVQLYMGPDGSNLPTMWGTLDGSVPVDVSSTTPLQKTICQQLGFKDGIMKTVDLSQTQPYNQSHVWLSSITCDGGEQHILRCGHTHGSSTPLHSADIFVNCSDSIRDASASNAYLGQLTLFPPAPCPDATVPTETINSASFGIVAVKQEAHNWMYFLSDTGSASSILRSSLNRSELDTVCRSAGFTHADPNSAMTVHSAETMFGYQFDRTVLNSKRDLSDIDCADSYQCLRQCCFHGNDEFHVMENTLDYMLDQALVIRCTFYESGDPVVPGGTQTACEVDDQSKNSGVCNLQTKTGGHEDRNIFVGVGAVLAIICTVSVGINVAVCITYVRRRRRAGYAPLNGADNGGPPPNGGQ